MYDMYTSGILFYFIRDLASDLKVQGKMALRWAILYY